MFSRRGFWALVAVALGIYLVMVLWSLPQVAGAAAGLTPFDMRPGGYSHDEALGFLQALTPEGRDFYLSVQLRLDTVYPPLLGLMLGIALWHLLAPMPVLLRLVALLLCLGVSLFDLLENARVAAMLRLDPAQVTAAMVASASRASVLKSSLTSVAMLLVVGASVLGAVMRRKGKRDV